MVAIQQSVYSVGGGWQLDSSADDVPAAQLVLYFADRALMETPDYHDLLKASYPGAAVVGCSSAGEIGRHGVHDGTAIAAAIGFESASVRLARKKLIKGLSAYAAGLALGAELGRADLRGVFILSDGLAVNGSELVRGLSRAVGHSVVVAGGLAGDGDRFGRTLVAADAPACSGIVAAIGFYGETLTFANAAVAGCEPFGPNRTITRSASNVLYEIDGYPALELYRRYLGDEAANLPASAQFLPLLVQPPDVVDGGLVRTPIGMDEAAGALVFAGDVHEGFVARLARAGAEQLVSGAAQCAAAAMPINVPGRKLALMVSGVGRKMVLGRSVGEETAAVTTGLGDGIVPTGFYAYGEIGAIPGSGVSHLHNQTMTVTVVGER